MIYLDYLETTYALTTWQYNQAVADGRICRCGKCFACAALAHYRNTRNTTSSVDTKRDIA